MRGRGTYGRARTFRTTSMPEPSFNWMSVMTMSGAAGDRSHCVLRGLREAHHFESAHRIDVFDDPLSDQLGVFDDEDA